MAFKQEEDIKQEDEDSQQQLQSAQGLASVSAGMLQPQTSPFGMQAQHAQPSLLTQPGAPTPLMQHPGIHSIGMYSFAL